MKCRTCGSAQSWEEAVLDALGESGSRSNSVIHGNCVEALRGLPKGSVDFVLTDPPYLVKYRNRSGQTIAGDRDGS